MPIRYLCLVATLLSLPPVGVTLVAPATKADFLEALDKDAVVYYSGHITYERNANGDYTDLCYVFSDGSVNADDIGGGASQSQARLVYFASCSSAVWIDYAPPAPDPHVYKPSLIEACVRKGARSAIGYSGEVDGWVSRALDDRCLRLLTKEGHGVSLAVLMAKAEFAGDYWFLGQAALAATGYNFMCAKPDGTNEVVWPATLAE
jgi:hypothetical protein